jgi:hypothetical protein
MHGAAAGPAENPGQLPGAGQLFLYSYGSRTDPLPFFTFSPKHTCSVKEKHFLFRQ